MQNRQQQQTLQQCENYDQCTAQQALDYAFWYNNSNNDR